MKQKARPFLLFGLFLTIATIFIIIFTFIIPTDDSQLTSKDSSKESTAQGIQVNFKWEGEGTPHIYFENLNGEKAKVISWPGIPMNAVSEQWYSYTINNAESADIIFTANNETYQTATLNRTAGNWWFSNGTWYSKNPDNTDLEQNASNNNTKTHSADDYIKTHYVEPKLVDDDKASIIIHYYNDSAVPQIYYWNSLPKNLSVEWPGVAMELESENWYKYSFEDVTKINFLFTYGLNQTKDLTRTTGEWWYKNGRWYKEKPSEGPSETPLPSERTDFRDETIYFLITTRFYDGDSSNNVHCWDENIKTDEDDPAWRGDFKGLIEKLDYIKALGFSAVWITPVVENCSGLDYHGYHALNFAKVDPRYESEDTNYQTLINACHERGMKIIQDVVFNHTGNFGETNLMPMFEKDDETGNYETIDCLKQTDNSLLPDDYDTLKPDDQYQTRLALMKDTSDPVIEGQKNDPYNLYHHYGFFNWDEYDCQVGQIAGDCVDLNTENSIVSNYITECYSKYINMGVDAFRVDTVKHISRLTFNNVFNKAFKAVGGENFFMFGEVCTKSSEIWYRGTTAPLSAPFYTWAETTDYPWNYYSADVESIYEAEKQKPYALKYSDFAGDPKQYENYLEEREKLETHLPYFENLTSAEDHYYDNFNGGSRDKEDEDKGYIGIKKQPVSTNHLLNGNTYHAPDTSKDSGLDVIDFTMHWNFMNASRAFNTAIGSYNQDGVDANSKLIPENAADHVYQDATWNVVYVDSHDYAPDGNSYLYRYKQGTDIWAENLNLMFTFRGIPCLYYGSEIEFMAGAKIDEGGNITLAESGRAYFGDHIEGDITTTDFGVYKNATGNIKKTLEYPLAKHIQRLNLIRRSIPALRKGQYSVKDVTYDYVAFKRRYTDDNTDSFACVTINDKATFTNLPNGTYTDAITGDVKEVTDGTLAIASPGQGNMRVYVLDTELTQAPGKIGVDGTYLK